MKQAGVVEATLDTRSEQARRDREGGSVERAGAVMARVSPRSLRLATEPRRGAGAASALPKGLLAGPPTLPGRSSGAGVRALRPQEVASTF
jgi:hypothetical protein